MLVRAIASGHARKRGVFSNLPHDALNRDVAPVAHCERPNPHRGLGENLIVCPANIVCPADKCAARRQTKRPGGAPGL